MIKSKFSLFILIFVLFLLSMNSADSWGYNFEVIYSSRNLSGHSVASECNPGGGTNCTCSDEDVSISFFPGYGEITSNLRGTNTYVNAIGYKKFTEAFPNGNPVILGTYKYTGQVKLPVLPIPDVNQLKNPQSVHMMIQLWDGRNVLYQNDKNTLEGAIYWELNPWSPDFGKIKVYTKPVNLIDTGILLTPDLEWHTFELVVNFENKKYVSITIDGTVKYLNTIDLAQVSQTSWGDDVSLTITTESMAAWPQPDCSNIFQWSTHFKDLEFSYDTGYICPPGWEGSVLIDGESLTNWTVEHDTGSSGSLELAEGMNNLAILLKWDIGTGDWVQGKYGFSDPVDLSGADIFGISLHGGGPDETANKSTIMFADVNDIFYGYDLQGVNDGANQIDRWLINLSIPKKRFQFLFSLDTRDITQIDWSRINRFFIVVKRPDQRPGGGSGSLTIDHVQYDTAANWPRQNHFETMNADPQISSRTIDYLLSQQKSTGLFLSWKEEPSPKAWLYDQALVLIALSREGIWDNGLPTNNAARAAKDLADFIINNQKDDGHWARGWNPETGHELIDDGWVGDQAWCVMALSIFFQKSGYSSAMSSAQIGAEWLTSKIGTSGKVVDSTEGNVDVWWAMISTSRFENAEKIESYLLSEETVWDAELRYWWRGSNDPVIAMDAATWLSAFARHPLVNRADMGMAALSFVKRTLITSNDDQTMCGFDGMGPVSIWNEGTAQYIAAGGEGGQSFFDMLISQQNPDGSMPGSPDNWATDVFGIWLSKWSGLAPTAWLYFSITGLPFLSLTIENAISVLQVLSNIVPAPTIGNLIDIDNDGRIGLSEVIYILQNLAGIR